MENGFYEHGNEVDGSQGLRVCHVVLLWTSRSFLSEVVTLMNYLVTPTNDCIELLLQSYCGHRWFHGARDLIPLSRSSSHRKSVGDSVVPLVCFPQKAISQLALYTHAWT